jgi:hypothetical protein
LVTLSSKPSLMSTLPKYPNVHRTCVRWRDILQTAIPPGAEVVFKVSREAEDRKPRHVGVSLLIDLNLVHVHLSPRLESMTSDKRDGVVLHELGHVILMLEGYDEHTEHDADRTAERVFGKKIRYDPEDWIQTTGPGVIRPARLR